jgi:hypothetical protein
MNEFKESDAEPPKAPAIEVVALQLARENDASESGVRGDIIKRAKEPFVAVGGAK